MKLSLNNYKFTHNIFLSHTSTDKPFARSLTHSLRDAGVKVWIDEAEIKVGDSLIEKIRDGIDNVEYVGVILSPSAVKSNWVKKELDVAMNQEIDSQKIKVVPILYKACELPGFLKGKLYADFTISFTDGFRALLKRLQPANSFEKNIFFAPNNIGKSGLAQPLVSLFNFKSIDGSYKIYGTNPNGKSYFGIAEIVSANNDITITSFVAGKTFVCKGFLKANQLAVTGDFYVKYEVLGNG